MLVNILNSDGFISLVIFSHYDVVDDFNLRLIRTNEENEENSAFLLILLCEIRKFMFKIQITIQKPSIQHETQLLKISKKKLSRCCYLEI